jgi:hypothetical protein
MSTLMDIHIEFGHFHDLRLACTTNALMKELTAISARPKALDVFATPQTRLQDLRLVVVVRDPVVTTRLGSIRGIG